MSAWQRRGTGPRPTPVLGWCLAGDALGVPRNPGEPNYRTPANPRFVRSALRQMITNCAFAREWHSIRCAMPGRRGRRPLRRDAANPRRGGYHPPARCGVKWMFRYSAHSQRTRFAVGATCGRPPVCSWISANSPIYGIAFKSSCAARCGHRALQECRIVGDGVLDSPRRTESYDCQSPANGCQFWVRPRIGIPFGAQRVVGDADPYDGCGATIPAGAAKQTAVISI